jgi:hypothetical protein
MVSSKLAPVYDPEADRFDNPEKLASWWQEMIKGMVQANLFTRSNFIKKTRLTNLISRRAFELPLHAVLSYLRGTLTDPLLHNLKSNSGASQLPGLSLRYHSVQTSRHSVYHYCNRRLSLLFPSLRHNLGGC